MNIDQEQNDKWQIFKVSGRLNGDSAAAFESYFSAINWGDDPQVVLELTGLEYLSSAGLRCIVILHRAITAKHGKLALASPKGFVSDVLAISGFASVLPVFENVETALSEFR